MGRPRKKKIFVTAKWYQQQRYEFLRIAFHHCPSAFISLRDDTFLPDDDSAHRVNKISVREWTQRYDLQDTWVEPWAVSTASRWKVVSEFPSYAPFPEIAYPGSGQVMIPEPGRCIPLSFPMPCRAIVLPSSGDRKSFRDYVASEIRKAVTVSDEWFDERIQDRSLTEIDKPQDFAVKLEYAALYYFGQVSLDNIAKRTNGIELAPKATVMAGCRQTIWRGLEEASVILELTLRERGHR